MALTSWVWSARDKAFKKSNPRNTPINLARSQALYNTRSQAHKASTRRNNMYTKALHRRHANTKNQKCLNTKTNLYCQRPSSKNKLLSSCDALEEKSRTLQVFKARLLQRTIDGQHSKGLDCFLACSLPRWFYRSVDYKGMSIVYCFLS